MLAEETSPEGIVEVEDHQFHLILLGEGSEVAAQNGVEAAEKFVDSVLVNGAEAREIVDSPLLGVGPVRSHFVICPVWEEGGVVGGELDEVAQEVAFSD